jgi:CheY-like chemotaxis protein
MDDHMTDLLADLDLEKDREPDILPLCSLASKRVVLVGFEDKQALQISRHLAQRKCLSRAMAPERLLWETADLQFADVIVFNWCPATVNSKWVKRDGMVDLRQPVLLVGSRFAISSMPVQLPRLSDAVETADEQMFEGIQRLITTAEDERRDRNGVRTIEPVRALVIDDDSDTRLLIATLVENMGLQCHMAADGREGVRMARKVMPHLVILDVNMPGPSGFDVLAAIRHYPGTSPALIMMLTGCHSEADVTKGYQLSADDYVMKPFSALSLTTRVRKLANLVMAESIGQS